MYKHLLVPTDGSELSAETIGNAVAFARDAGARITFFHATPDYLATGDGALLRSVSPELAAEQADGHARAILSKAEAAARAAEVPHDSLCKISDRPYEAILEAAEERGCDVIFTASRGPRSIGGLLLGSETLKVLMHSKIPVLVSSVAKNSPTPGMNKAVAIIHDEHRSLAVVLHGLRYLLDAADSKNLAPDSKLIGAMLYYIREFPERLHHPKEDSYLFAKVRMRTREVDDVLLELERHHADNKHLLANLEQAFAGLEAGTDQHLERFSAALARYTEAQWSHMSLEETVIIPAAKKHLHAEDWDEIAEAFGKNGDPRFGAEPDTAFRNMFARIARLALPAVAAGSES